MEYQNSRGMILTQYLVPQNAAKKVSKVMATSCQMKRIIDTYAVEEVVDWAHGMRPRFWEEEKTVQWWCGGNLWGKLSPP